MKIIISMEHKQQKISPFMLLGNSSNTVCLLAIFDHKIAFVCDINTLLFHLAWCTGSGAIK